MDAREVHVGVRELRGNLTHFLREASLGACVIVTLRDKVVAEIRAPQPTVRVKRQPGGLKGRIWMAADFDEWPEDILAAIEE